MSSLVFIFCQPQQLVEKLVAFDFGNGFMVLESKQLNFVTDMCIYNKNDLSNTYKLSRKRSIWCVILIVKG